MSNPEISVTAIGKFLSWCQSPIGMLTILIIIAALGIVTLMTIRENCTTSDLSYRVVRTLFIAGYACFVLNFAGSLVAQIIAAIIKLFTVKWIATVIVIGLTLVSYIIAIYLCGRPDLDKVKAIGRSMPFWLIAIFALPTGAYGIYHSGWLVAGALIAEVLLWAGAVDFVEKKAPWKISEPQKIKKIARPEPEKTEDTGIVSNILHETGRVIQKIT